jgi:hypothetical protein
MSSDAKPKPRRPKTFGMVMPGASGHSIMKILQESGTTDSDRALGIVWGSVVEMCLDHAIRDSFHYHKKIFDNRFHSSAPFGSFAVKIDLGFLTGLYSESAWRDFVILKDIRNKFAHDAEVSSFDDDSISALCGNFKLIERYAGDNEEAAEKREPQGHLPISEWRRWVFTHDLKGELSYPCGRFMLTVQVLTWALSAKPNPKREPHF